MKRICIALLFLLLISVCSLMASPIYKSFTVNGETVRRWVIESFVTEYDAVASPTDDPMVFQGMSRLNPPVPESQQCDVAQYVYDAGNVNLFQASEAAKYYSVKRLPAVVVDGRVLSSPSASAITGAVK